MIDRSLEIRGLIVGGILRLPAGGKLLAVLRTVARLVRAAVLRLRRGRSEPPPPRPWKEHDRLVVLTRFEQRNPFLSTNQLVGRCRYVFAEDRTFVVNEGCDNDWCFVRTDDLHVFFDGCAPREPFVLFTGHSDLPVDRSHRRYLERPELRAWFAVNPVIEHPKLRARPIGVVSPCWPNGDSELLHAARDAQMPKTRIFHVAFTVKSNPFERAYCLAQTGLSLESEQRVGAEYFDDLASSRFCISPKGAGIDCCRTWEALVVRTIPVVTRSLVADQHADFPMIVLDDWAQFRSIRFTPELYERTWGGWDSDGLLLDRYLERVERQIAEIAGRSSLRRSVL